MEEEGVALRIKSASTIVKKESTDGIEKVLYCSIGLAKSLGALKCPWIRLQLQAKFIPNQKKNLKALLRRK